MGVEERLQELGIELPEPQAALANYLPFVITGNLVSVSGQVAMADGHPRWVGKVGDKVSLEEAVEAARVCAIQIIAHLQAACEGDLERLRRIVRLGGFVNCIEGYTNQPKIINGASDLMVEVFGDRGRHSRAAVGTSSLPLNVPVEIDCLAEIA
ncbi:MAG: RidA family protein [Proteobacteria bacterium]|nr:RidA family protein [Pseudomonadota bacterium]